jgi:hypothetical protein
MSALAFDSPAMLDFGQALAMFRKNAEQRRDALRDWERAIQVAADLDAQYAKAYARAIVSAEGTAAVREALARSETADERARRDVSRDMIAVCRERFRSLEGERANINGLVDWSKRVDHGVGG